MPLLTGAVAFSSAAVAHVEAGWLHGMSDGAVRFFTALEFLLPVLMVALLARRRGPGPAIIQAAALGIGILFVGLGLPLTGDPPAVGLYARGYLVALALLVLFDLRLHSGLLPVLAFATGTLIGLEAGNAVGGDPATGIATVVGFLSSAIFFCLPVALIASRYTEGWQRIAMRVVASWIAAIAAIDIAFMIARPG